MLLAAVAYPAPILCVGFLGLTIANALVFDWIESRNPYSIARLTAGFQDTPNKPVPLTRPPRSPRLQKAALDGR